MQQLNVPAIYEPGLSSAVVLLKCHIFQCDSLPLFMWEFDFGTNMVHFNKTKLENKKILALIVALKQVDSAPKILDVQRLSLKFTKDGLEILIKAPALCWRANKLLNTLFHAHHCGAAHAVWLYCIVPVWQRLGFTQSL